MSQDSRLQSISDLTSAQQQVLRIVLQIPAYTFKTSDIRAKVGADSNGCSVGGVLGSLARLGIVEKIASGRNKEWRVSGHIRERQSELTLDLWANQSSSNKPAQPTLAQPKADRRQFDEIMAELRGL